jgi:hypothetical protein
MAEQDYDTIGPKGILKRSVMFVDPPTKLGDYQTVASLDHGTNVCMTLETFLDLLKRAGVDPGPSLTSYI